MDLLKYVQELTNSSQSEVQEMLKILEEEYGIVSPGGDVYQSIQRKQP